MAISWYGWVGGAAGAFVCVVASSLHAWRKQLVDELIAYLAKHLPEWRVESRSNSRLVLRKGDGDSAEFSLYNLRVAASKLRGDAEMQAKGREELFAISIAAFQEQMELLDNSVDPAVLLARLYPRIVNESFFASVPDSSTIPHRALGNTSLFVVYVIDSPHAVAYVDATRLTSLGVDEAALHARALDNLSRLWSVEATRKAVENGSVVVTKAFDTYDAARLLLLPGRLRESEEVAVLIPDRDTLVLAPVPSDGDWTQLDKLAKNRAGPELFNRALRVSAAGIRVA